MKKNFATQTAFLLLMLYLFTGSAVAYETKNVTAELAAYDYAVDAGWNDFGEIYCPGYNVGEQTYLEVPSAEYPDATALMDVATGILVCDNLEAINPLSEYSDLVVLKQDGRIVVFDLEKQQEICQLANDNLMLYAGRFSEAGGFVTLASDEKLHFISNDGVIGNAANLDYSQYTDPLKPPVVRRYLGEGLYQFGIGKTAYNYESIGIINQNGDVVAYYADGVYNFINGYCIIVKDGKRGVINASGEEIIPCEYDQLKHFGDLFLAQRGDVYYDLNVNGETLTTFQPDASLYDFVDDYIGNGLAVVCKKGKINWENKYGLVDCENNIVMPIEYAGIDVNFAEDMYCVRLTQIYMGDSVYGYIDETGSIAVPFIYDNAYGFSEGLAVVSKDGKYGFIDKTGTVVIPFLYSYAGSFSNGVATVWTEDDIEININKNNEIVPKNDETENEKAPKYELTNPYTYEWDMQAGYIGGVKLNNINRIADISHFGVFPVVVGTNGQYVIAFSKDFQKMYRITFNEEDIPYTKSVAEQKAGGVAVHVELFSIPEGSNLIAAGYKNNKLKVLETVSSAERIETITFHADVDVIKIMAWDGFGNLQPITGIEEISKDKWKQ